MIAYTDDEKFGITKVNIISIDDPSIKEINIYPFRKKYYKFNS